MVLTPQASVPRLWPDATIVCLGTGPSLTQADVEACRDRVPVIAIKDAIQWAPWAEVLYCGEERWWQHYGPTLTFPGRRYTVHPQCGAWATVLKGTGATGLELTPTGLRTGKTSGYQAINLAVHLGARVVVLLGYDLQPGPDGRSNFCGSHPYAKKAPPYGFAPVFRELVEPLRAIGVRVLNASRATALTCFPRLALAEALAC